MKKQFRIGPFFFGLDYPENLTPPENFMLFDTDEAAEAPYQYMITAADILPEPTLPLCAQREDLIIYSDGQREERKIGMKGTGAFYAFSREPDENHTSIVILNPEGAWKPFYSLDTIFNSLLALERRFLNYQAMILHCSYTSYRGEAILFSAPSETGKSTQSRLWEEYRGSGTVNGDRGLLCRTISENETAAWTAGGFPVCGSSEICHDETLPVKAIVMLRQAPENSVRRLSAAEAFHEIFAQITINSWNSGYVMQTMDQLEQLIGEVPVYQLSCNISEDAVICLEKVLYPQVQ